MSKLGFLAASFVAAVLFGRAYCQTHEDDLEPERRAIRFQQAQLNAKIAALSNDNSNCNGSTGSMPDSR